MEVAKTPRERLIQFQRKSELSDNTIAGLIGVSQTAYSKYVREGKSIGKVVQKVLERFDDLNANWLITGTGNMYIGDWAKSIAEDAVAQHVLEEQGLTGPAYVAGGMTEQHDGNAAWLSALQKDNDSLRARIIELERENAILGERLRVANK